MDFCMSVATQVMLDEMKKKEGGSPKNVVVSPVSISMVLELLASGSAGETLDQFLEILGSKNTDDLNSKSSTMMSLLAPSTDGPESSDSTTDHAPKNSPNDTVAPPRFPISHYKLYRDMYHIAPRARSSMSCDIRPQQYKEESSIPKKPKKKGPVFNFVNAVWVDRRFPLIPSFQEMAKTTYKARVLNVDLVHEAKKVKEEVNLWAAKATKGLIKEIVPPALQLKPPLCLANALYFKGLWKIPFRASMTYPKEFHLVNGDTVRVPFMTEKNERYSYGEFDDFKLLQLPYESSQDISNQFSMYIFLPIARDGLEDLVNKFDSDPKMLQTKMCYLKREELSWLWIPKMKFSYDFEPKRLMKGKGLTLPFEPLDADFTKMVHSLIDNVYVDSIFHKACFEVNEDGTEAAAVSEEHMLLTAARWQHKRSKPSFVADHPFMFTIVDDSSKVVVFTGVVVNPLLD